MDFNDKQIEIIDIAEQLFALQGYDGTSVRDIASKANINVAMISYYFKLFISYTPDNKSYYFTC